MYLVVSRWEPLPGMEAEFEKRGRPVRDILRQQPGVVMIEGFETEDGRIMAIHAYESEEAYRRVIDDPNGAFAKAVEDNRLEECSRWLGSDRGYTVDHTAPV